MRFPPVELVPETVRGRAFVIVEAAVLGTEASSLGVLRPMRELEPAMDTCASLTPANPPLGHPYGSARPGADTGDGGLMTDFPAAAVHALVELEGPGIDSPLTSFEIRRLAGAPRPPRGTGGALAAIEAPFAWFALGFAPMPEAVPVVDARVEALHEALRPWDFGRRYMNFTEVQVGADLLFPPGVDERPEGAPLPVRPGRASATGEPPDPIAGPAAARLGVIRLPHDAARPPCR